MFKKSVIVCALMAALSFSADAAKKRGPKPPKSEKECNLLCSSMDLDKAFECSKECTKPENIKTSGNLLNVYQKECLKIDKGDNKRRNWCGHIKNNLIRILVLSKLGEDGQPLKEFMEKNLKSVEEMKAMESKAASAAKTAASEAKSAPSETKAASAPKPAASSAAAA
jgi:hypothetical protein